MNIVVPAYMVDLIIDAKAKNIDYEHVYIAICDTVHFTYVSPLAIEQVICKIYGLPDNHITAQRFIKTCWIKINQFNRKDK